MLYLYRWMIVPTLMSLFRALSWIHPKVRKGWQLRVQAPLPHKASGGVWFHCASGEFEYAKPVIREIKRLRPDLKVGVTYFSPSVIESLKAFDEVDETYPLPWDRPRPIARFLEAARPCTFLIARTDLWPELLHQCRARGIPIVLFSATLTEQSGRMHPLARPFYGWVTGHLNWITCVSEDDRKIFRRLAPHVPCDVLGDSRFDQVIARLDQPKLLRSEHRPTGELVIVAGSTWPEDEAVLLPAFAEIRKFAPTAQLILAPHEPSHLQALEKQISELGLKSVRYSEAARPSAVLLVDQVGILAELYSWAQIAFVGGSFRKSVHSVMEPLAAGCLTFVGPYHRNNREALRFAQHPLGEFKMVEVVRSSAEIVQRVQAAAKASGWAEWKKEIRAHVQRSAQVSPSLVQGLFEKKFLN